MTINGHIYEGGQMGKIRSGSRLKIINAIKAAGEKGITGHNIKQQTGVSNINNYLQVNDMVAEEKVGCDIIYYWVGKNDENRGTARATTLRAGNQRRRL